jgi:hypothetical protein
MRGDATTLTIVVFGFIIPTLATDFNKCFNDIRSGVYGTEGGTDINGSPVNISKAVGISFALCERACGTGSEAFEWVAFSQKFTSWLLPWLALISQLPFGASDGVDNPLVIPLSVGSPTLAAYSLLLTVLNRRWLAKRLDLESATHRHVNDAFHILDGLQHFPLQITNEADSLHSLVVQQENDTWWEQLVKSLDYTHTWSLSALAAMAWVILAYVFTVISTFVDRNSFYSTGNLTSGISDGHSVGTAWLWLLPVVFMWQQISPKCDIKSVEQALADANKTVYRVSKDDRGVIHAFTKRKVDGDESCSPPIYNYARILPWTQGVEEVVAALKCAHMTPRAGAPHEQHPTLPGGTDARASSREEPRNDYTYPPAHCNSATQARSRWGPGVWKRIIIAAGVALMLQWGTAGAAVLIIWLTPTTGLGCRSLHLLVYAGISTLIWAMLVTSSILTHFLAAKTLEQQSHLTRFIHVVELLLRCVAKALACCNTALIILSSTLQFGNIFNRCYCNSSVLGRKSHACDVLVTSLEDVKGPWAGGLVLACGCVIIFMLVVFICTRISEPTTKPNTRTASNKQPTPPAH